MSIYPNIAGSPPAGGGANVTISDIAFDFGYMFYGHGESTSAYACKGGVVDMVVAASFLRIGSYFYTSVGTNATYKFVIGKVDASYNLTEILWSSSEFSIEQNGDWHEEVIPDASAVVLAGDKVALMIVRTDGTGTSAVDVDFVINTPKTDMMPASYTFDRSIRLASNNPVVGNNLPTVTGSVAFATTLKTN